MFLTNGMKATLIKHNRKQTGVWDDEYTESVPIILCPYNQDIRVAFGVYTIPEAEGFYIVKNTTDMNRAPRNSVLAELLTLQALSVALQANKNWDPVRYVRCHPGGALGQIRDNEK